MLSRFDKIIILKILEFHYQLGFSWLYRRNILNFLIFGRMNGLFMNFACSGKSDLAHICLDQPIKTDYISFIWYISFACSSVGSLEIA